MRSQEEIQRQIDGIEAMKEWLPEENVFGDNNWEIMDIQVGILDGSIDPNKDLSEIFDEDIYDQEANYQIECAIQETVDWLEGVNDDDLFEER